MIRPTSHADYFIATEKPSGYFHDSRYLYAFDDYLTLNRPPECSFFLINTRNKLIAGTSFFFQENKEWLSPFKAPFGGFDISDTPKEIIKEFVQ